MTHLRDMMRLQGDERTPVTAKPFPTVNPWITRRPLGALFICASLMKKIRRYCPPFGLSCSISRII